jgi:cell division protein FtsI/penicillin-binding protein 2
MQTTILGRARFLGIGLAGFAVLVIVQLVRIQFGADQTYFRDLSVEISSQAREFAPARGSIYDRNGELLATNDVQYEIGINPVFVVNPDHVVRALSDTLGKPASEIEAAVASDERYVLIARPVSGEMGDHLIQLSETEGINLSGVSVTPIAHRSYPGGLLAAQALGFVGYNPLGSQVGYYGVEGFYNDLLSGKSVQGVEQLVPFDAQPNPVPAQGSDLVLTIDRDIQFLVEGILNNAVVRYGAQGGTIVVMDPQTGEILAMAGSPSYDPNNYGAAPIPEPQNPAVTGQYEPGSTFKILTMAAALDSGLVNPNSTFTDNGVIEVGGAEIRNWDGGGWGLQDMTGCLRHSLNVCMAWLSTSMGPTTFYDYMRAFGIGERTNVDLANEAPGRLKVPGDADWFDSDLGTNAYGQGVAVTPLQLLAAISAVANDGVMMQPHILREVRNGNAVHTTNLQQLGQPISPETAQTLSQMLAVSLETGEATTALVPGYRIAGKTGTASIPVPGGYDLQQTIASFVGWGPIDDPKFLVLVRLDRPTASIWGSETAAPVFGTLAQRLVVLMQIPPDDIRLRMADGN